MSLRVKILHFDVGIGPLGGRLAVAASGAEATGGVPPVDSIRRIGGGYLVGFKGRLFTVPDSRVLCAEVEEVADEVPSPMAANDDVLAAQRNRKPAAKAA